MRLALWEIFIFDGDQGRSLFMYTTSDIRRGLKIELDGKPFIVIEFLHVKPGKGGAFVRTKLKNMETGQVIDKTFRSGERLTPADLDEREMQFLYKDQDGYHFMDNNTYEQIFLTENQLGEAKNYLQDNLTIKVLFFNDKPIGIELPTTVSLRVERTDPGLRGDTATGGTKPATMETGLVVQVPLFINEGDLLKVDTRTGEYVERVK